MSDREEMQANRAAGVARRNETRHERAIRRAAIEEYQASDERHLNSCIWIDPGRQTGQPCFGGTRIPVDPFMAIVEEAGEEAAKAFWPNVTDEHIKAGRLWRERYSAPSVDSESPPERCGLADLDNRCAQFGETS